TFSITDLQLNVGGINSTVKSPAPVQVVFNPHATASIGPPANPDPGPFDLVLGKATAFLVGVKVDQLSLVPPTGVALRVVFGSSSPFSSVFVLPQCSLGQTTNCFKPDGTATTVINQGFTPQALGNNLPVV